MCNFQLRLIDILHLYCYMWHIATMLHELCIFIQIMVILMVDMDTHMALVWVRTVYCVILISRILKWTFGHSCILSISAEYLKKGFIQMIKLRHNVVPKSILKMICKLVVHSVLVNNCNKLKITTLHETFLSHLPKYKFYQPTKSYAT